MWIGLDIGREYLISLSKDIEDKINFQRNGKHSPHLTIGRVRSDKNNELLLEKIEEYRDVNIGEMEVNNVKLKKSTLTQKGPVYEDVSTFNLK